MNFYIPSPLGVVKKVKFWIYHFFCSLLYAVENYQKRYPYILLGEKYQENKKETILLYRIVGKRHVFEMSAKEVCNSKKMISKFHPLDVRIISFIAGVEQILSVPIENRENKFLELKCKIFKHPFK